MVVPSEFTVRKSTRTESTILFDGSNDYIDCTNDATLWSQSLTKFSFSVWIYPTHSQGDVNDRMVVQHGTVATAQSFRLYVLGGTDFTVIFQIRNAANSPIEAACDFGDLYLNQWNCVTCVYDNSLGSANLKIYVNGKLGASTGNLTEAINLSAILTLGDSSTDFKGNMKNFKFWKSVALSQQNVSDLYNGKRSLAPTPNYWLPMNEGAGSPKDLIGNLTGTLTNGAVYNTMSNAPTSLGSDPDLGGSGLIDLKGENNMYPSASGLEARFGSTKYRIYYWRYIGSESPVKDCSMAQFFDTPQGVTKVEWAFDSTIPLPYYKYNPRQFFNGISDFVLQADSAALDLTQFSVAAWFRTTGNVTEMEIVNKGGIGSDAAGENDNYSIRMSVGNKILGGFEEGNGTDHYATSPLSYNDGVWHFAVVTYDQVTVRLYIDGLEVATHVTSTLPETNLKDLVIGRNSRASDRFFFGDIDEVRVWNNDLTAEEVLNLYNSGTVPQSGAIVYTNLFGTTDTSLTAQQLVNENEEPFGSPVWQEVTESVPSPTNIGDFKTNQYIPILFKYTILPGTLETSIENDTSVFRMYFGIQPTQTGGGGEGGGTPPAANEDNVIVFNGDWGEESQTTTMVNHAKSLNPQMVLSGGDNVYASSASQFLQKVKPIDDNQGATIILEVAIGNHDDSSSIIADLKGHFGYDQTYHDHRLGNIYILFLDSENSPTGSAQVDWAKGKLAQARADNTVDWIFVIFHRPIYTAASNHSPDESGMRTTWSPIFEQYKVDLVLQSHNHNCQRTYPVLNQSANNPQIVDSGAGPYADWLGVIFVINGTGGHDAGGNLYKITNSPAFNAFQKDDTNMNLKIATSNNGKTLTCSFIATDNTVEHSWVMTRS